MICATYIHVLLWYFGETWHDAITIHPVKLNLSKRPWRTGNLVNIQLGHHKILPRNAWMKTWNILKRWKISFLLTWKRCQTDVWTIKGHSRNTMSKLTSQSHSIPPRCHCFSISDFFLGQVAKGSNHISIQLDSLSHVDFACATLLRDLARYGLLNGFCDDEDTE